MKRVIPKLNKGNYIRTGRDGNDYYAADAYSVEDVKKYIKMAEAKIKQLKINYRTLK